MLTAYQGQSVTIDAAFSSGVTLVEVAGVTVAITAPGGATELAATAVGITNPATGVYEYVWPVPITALVGTHVVNWAATYSGSPVGATVALSVTAAASQTWCTAADVLAFTGITVADAVVSQAGAMIDVACARPFQTFIVNVPVGQVCKISATDQYWLRLACAYQASWLPSQVDVYQRIDAAAVQAGRRMITLNPGAIVLSPLAQAALRRVSFMKSRSLHVPGPMDLDRPWLGNGVGDDGDGGPGWVDLGPVG